MNLILSQNPAKLGLFEKPPVSSQTQALVYENRKNQYVVVKNGDQMTKSEIRSGNYHTFYRVNTGVIDFDFEREYPSEVEIESIKIKTSITIRVIDPQRIIENQLDDPRSKIEGDLDLYIKRITRGYSIDHLFGLEEDVNDLVNDSSLIKKLKARGLEITEITSLVSMSEERRKELKSLDSLDKTTRYKKKETESNSTLSELERGEQLKELDYVRTVYQDYGYLGARTVFREDEKLTEILQEIHEQFEKEKARKMQREEERQDEVSKVVKKLIDSGASKDEIDEAVQSLNAAYGVENEAALTKEIPETGTTSKDKLKEKLKKFNEAEGDEVNGSPQ